MAVWQKIISANGFSECSGIVGMSGIKGSKGTDFVDALKDNNRIVVPICWQPDLSDELDTRYDDTIYYDGDVVAGGGLGDFNDDFSNDFLI